MNKITRFSGYLLCVSLCLAACSNTPTSTIDMNAVQTYVVQTAAVASTRTAQAASPTTPPTATATEVSLAVATATSVSSPTPQPPTPTLTPPTPLVAKTPVVSTGQQIERDDFEQGQFWYTESATKYQMMYDQGGYRMRSSMPLVLLHSVRSLTVEDTVVEIDANALDASEGSYWGVACRYVDDENFYALLIGADGLYGIGKMDGGQFQFIKKDTIIDKTIYKPDENGFVHIRGDCVGDSLTLYANGVQLLQVKDTEFKSGSIGLVVRQAATEIWIDILFDNYLLSQPGAKNE